jgi:hypothetical protein
MKQQQQCIGLDVHKDSISIAVAAGGTFAAARDLARIPHELPRLLKLLARLHQRYRRMLMRHTQLQHIIVAIARELAGFVWAIGQHVPAKAA